MRGSGEGAGEGAGKGVEREWGGSGEGVGIAPFDKGVSLGATILAGVGGREGGKGLELGGRPLQKPFFFIYFNSSFQFPPPCLVRVDDVAWRGVNLSSATQAKLPLIHFFTSTLVSSFSPSSTTTTTITTCLVGVDHVAGRRVELRHPAGKFGGVGEGGGEKDLRICAFYYTISFY